MCIDYQNLTIIAILNRIGTDSNEMKYLKCDYIVNCTLTHSISKVTNN